MGVTTSGLVLTRPKKTVTEISIAFAEPESESDSEPEPEPESVQSALDALPGITCCFFGSRIVVAKLRAISILSIPVLTTKSRSLFPIEFAAKCK